MSEKIEALKAFANAAFGRFDMSTKDLREAELEWRPDEEANNIRWILQHLSQQWNVGFQRTFKGDNGYKDLGTSWGDFCDKVYDGKDPVMKSFGTLGACVASGLGDGVYAVKALVQEVRGCGPRVCAIQVTFVRKSERV